MSQEFFDAEAQQHAADLDIVREIRHNDASLYQLAHGRGARWQFDQLKSQLEERDAINKINQQAAENCNRRVLELQRKYDDLLNTISEERLLETTDRLKSQLEEKEKEFQEVLLKNVRYGEKIYIMNEE